MPSLTNRIQQLGSTLKLMTVEIDSEELAVAFMYGLQLQYENIFTTIDALCEDSEIFTLEVAESQLFYKEKRRSLQKHDYLETALIGSSIKRSRVGQFWPTSSCSYCKLRGHTKD